VYGALAGVTFGVGVGDVLFRNCKVGGYWLGTWYPSASQETKDRMIKELWEAYALPGFGDHVGTIYPLEKVAEAIAESVKEGRGGKVFLR
jgi:NADPH:quinone reductase-like Zn-dependent oxidoreductase